MGTLDSRGVISNRIIDQATMFRLVDALEGCSGHFVLIFDEFHRFVARRMDPIWLLSLGWVRSKLNPLIPGA